MLNYDVIISWQAFCENHEARENVQAVSLEDAYQEALVFAAEIVTEQSVNIDYLSVQKVNPEPAKEAPEMDLEIVNLLVPSPDRTLTLLSADQKTQDKARTLLERVQQSEK